MVELESVLANTPIGQTQGHLRYFVMSWLYRCLGIYRDILENIDGYFDKKK